MSVNDTLFTNSSQPLGSAIAPREEQQEVKDAKELQEIVANVLNPVNETVDSVIANRIAMATDVRSFFKTFTEVPNSQDLYHEYRARELYVKFLEDFKAELVGELSKRLK